MRTVPTADTLTHHAAAEAAASEHATAIFEAAVHDARRARALLGECGCAVKEIAEEDLMQWTAAQTGETVCLGALLNRQGRRVRISKETVNLLRESLSAAPASDLTKLKILGSELARGAGRLDVPLVPAHDAYTSPRHAAAAAAGAGSPLPLGGGGGVMSPHGPLSGAHSSMRADGASPAVGVPVPALPPRPHGAIDDLEESMASGAYSRLVKCGLTLMRAAAVPLEAVPHTMAMLHASDQALHEHVSAAAQYKASYNAARDGGRFGDADQHLSDLCDVLQDGFKLMSERLAVVDSPASLDEDLARHTKDALAAYNDEVTSAKVAAEQMSDDIATDLVTLADSHLEVERLHAAALEEAQAAVDVSVDALSTNATAQEKALAAATEALSELARLGRDRVALARAYREKETAKRDLAAAHYKTCEAFGTHKGLLNAAETSLRQLRSALGDMAAAGEQRAAAHTGDVEAGQAQVAALQATERDGHYEWYKDLLSHLGENLYVRERRAAELQRSLEQAVWRKKVSETTLDHAGTSGCLDNVAQVTAELKDATARADALRAAVARAERDAEAVEKIMIAEGRAANPAAEDVRAALKERARALETTRQSVLNMREASAALRDNAVPLADISEAQEPHHETLASPPRGTSFEPVASAVERRRAYMDRLSGVPAVAASTAAAGSAPRFASPYRAGVPVYTAGSPSPERVGSVPRAAATLSASPPPFPHHRAGSASAAANTPSPAHVGETIASPVATSVPLPSWAATPPPKLGSIGGPSCEELRVRAEQLRQAAVESRRRAQCHREQARSMSPQRQ